MGIIDILILGMLVNIGSVILHALVLFFTTIKYSPLDLVKLETELNTYKKSKIGVIVMFVPFYKFFESLYKTYILIKMDFNLFQYARYCHSKGIFLNLV